MAVIIPPGYVQVQMNWVSPNLFKGRGVTTFGASQGAGSFGDMATAVGAAWLANLQALCSDNLTLEGVRVFNDTTAGEALVGQAGTVTQTQAEPNIALLTRKVSNRRGPRAKARSYWPGMAFEATYDEKGLMNEDSREDYQAGFNGFTEDLLVAFDNLVILQGDEGISAPLNPPPTFTAFLVDRRAATQRRRLRS